MVYRKYDTPILRGKLVGIIVDLSILSVHLIVSDRDQFAEMPTQFQTAKLHPAFCKAEYILTLVLC